MEYLWEGLLHSCQPQVSAQRQQGLAEGLQEGGEVLRKEAGAPAGQVVLGAQPVGRIQLNHV